MNIVKEGLNSLGLDYTNRDTKLLNRYISEIEMWNPRYGLVNASGEMLIRKHILDSLTAIDIIKKLNVLTIADVGSGAGLPGIPIAIMLPQIRVSLVERSGKRVRFLKNVQALLGLDNLEIIEEDLKNVKTKFDLVTFRAFKPIEPKIMKLLMNILNESGRLLAYKGKKELILSEIELVKELAQLEYIFPVNLPGLSDERNLVLYKN